jgi:hypothetical protein
MKIYLTDERAAFEQSRAAFLTVFAGGTSNDYREDFAESFPSLNFREGD